MPLRRAARSPQVARGDLAEDNDEDIDEREDDGPGPDNLKIYLETMSNLGPRWLERHQ